MSDPHKKFTSIQLTHSAKNALEKKKHKGETYEQMLRRKGLI